VRLDGLGDPLDPVQAGVPAGADGGQLGGGAGQLGLVDLVTSFAPGRRGVDQPGPVEDG